MVALGTLLIVVMGLTLGILGGGGSILTVPILTYFFDIPASLSTGYSLFIVGITSLFGAYRYGKQGLLDYKVAAIFAIPSTLGVLLSRKWILTQLPPAHKDQIILGAFAALVIVISMLMLRSKEPTGQDDTATSHPTSLYTILLGLKGLLVGMATGFVGAGGGFMIVPSLVFMAKISLRRAIATSLLIISVNSLIGFTGDLTEGLPFNARFLLGLSAITILSVIVGTRWSQSLPTHKLRHGFGYFVLLVGILILIKEFIA